MKISTLFILIGLIISLSNCTKSSNTQSTPCDGLNVNKNPINCDGLITDTAGTNDSARILVLNVATPNGDGHNDFFNVIENSFATGINLTIYDNNNNVVYNSNVSRWQPPTITTNNTAIEYYYKIQATTIRGRHIGLCGHLYALSCIPNCLKDSLYFGDQDDPIMYCHF